MIYKDLTGKKFGVLEVQRMIKKKTHYRAWCKCLNCGKERLCEPFNLRKITNGGCKCIPRNRKPVLEDITDKKFGMLKVTRMEQKGSNGQYYAICDCNCGKKDHWILPGSLKREKNPTTSCGCRRDQYLKNTGKNSAQFTGFEGISGRFISTIKRRAKNRNYEFNLKPKELWLKYLGQSQLCALSGVPITIGRSNKETTASLDRIESDKGYLIENVQWVHKKINIMKNVFKQEEFIEFCHLVSRKHRK